MKLFNTASKNIEDVPHHEGKPTTFYSCGPTVYDDTHIGHMRTYINNDTLRRALKYCGYTVHHVMNITDVGHLTGDTDEGEDKLEKGAKKTGKTVWQVAEEYTQQFTDTMQALHVLPPDQTCKATDHIGDMIALIQTLAQKGYTYETDEAIYFDTTKFEGYGKLSGQKIEEKIQKARAEVQVDTQKKHPADFALWFKTVGRFADHEMRWRSPWGEGFPGWHIECSAMSMKYLGETIDIHSGGVDHIPVHHENEIAQSESATGKPFVKMWFHNAFLLVNGAKMSKSLNNFFTLRDLRSKQIDPIAVRLLFLQTHYQQEMNFTWEAVHAAQTALNKLREQVLLLRNQTQRQVLSEDKLHQVDEYRMSFRAALENNLQCPQAVAVVWSMIKSNIPSEDKLDLLYEFDEVLGLGLHDVKEDVLPDEIRALKEERDRARLEKNFSASDELKKKIESQGYVVQDVVDGSAVKKSN